MKITDKYFMKTDPYNFILCERIKVKDKKTGEIKDGEKIIGYFNSIKPLLNIVLQKEIRETKRKDIKELIKAVDKIEKNIFLLGKELTK